MKKLFVLFTALALVVAFTLPASAASTWNFYGSARIATFYTDASEEAGDVQNFDLGLQGNSRFGARVKNGAIGGRFEYGTGVNLRLLYGTWDFGGGQLLVGQTYTPVNLFYSNQVFGSDTDLLNFGGVYSGRHPMLRLSIGDFKVALVQVFADSDLGTDGGTETLLPRLELSYDLKAGPVGLKFAAGYQTYTADPNGVDETVDSYVGAIGASFGFGPVTLGLDGYFAQNAGQWGLFNHGADDAILVGDSVEDTTTYGGILVVNFKATPTLSFEVGGGYVLNENDEQEDDDGLAYYANAVITLAPGFFIVPEVGVSDFGDDASGHDAGDELYFGAKWQINF
jgi:hypothetical protein